MRWIVSFTIVIFGCGAPTAPPVTITPVSLSSSQLERIVIDNARMRYVLSTCNRAMNQYQEQWKRENK